MSRRLIEALVPLTQAEFDFAMEAAHAAFDGKLIPNDYWSRPAITLTDGDEVSDIYLTGAPQVRAMMAGGQTFGDDRDRANSFRWRFLSLGSILRHKRFRDDYVHGGMVDDVLVAAIASAPMHIRMNARQLVASVARELKRRAGAS